MLRDKKSPVALLCSLLIVPKKNQQARLSSLVCLQCVPEGPLGQCHKLRR